MGMSNALKGIFGSSHESDGDYTGGAAGAASDAYNKYAQQAIDKYKTAEAGAANYYAPVGDALGKYAQSAGLGPSGSPVMDMFKQSPGYKYAQQSGTNAIQKEMAAHGMSGTGAEGKELTKYSQNLANQQYGAYQDRLQNLAGFGAQGQQVAGGYAGQIGNALTGIGTSDANSILTQARMQAEEREAQEAADAQSESGWAGAAGKVAGAVIPFL